MKKMTGLVVAIVLAVTMLSGCCSKSCAEPTNYKDAAPAPRCN